MSAGDVARRVRVMTEQALGFGDPNGFAPKRIRKYRLRDQLTILAQFARRVDDPTMQERWLSGLAAYRS